MPWYLPLYRPLFRSSTFLSYFLKKPRNILKKQGVKGYMRSRFCGMIFESGRKRTGLPIQPSAFLFYCLPNNIFTPPMSFRGFYQSTKIGSPFLFLLVILHADKNSRRGPAYASQSQKCFRRRLLEDGTVSHHHPQRQPEDA